ncbi:heavy metal-associated isoprenylated plant protein 2 isoform X2 [Salvia hispanica]|uniref:heavy metal-associated isoprenylated plant protein 2 isoform X2 n=1 Tax=Salvia hispanica TaxID=49212 RepID=UPI0020094AF6|nr:heavy metal-associated isoprenylated plant protein 2 isoform X2 [Salvia hispanica]
MSAKEIELSVSISNQKCRIRILKAVAKLTGVDVLKVDAEKGQLTVVGNVDPVAVATAIRKAGYSADITSVGPPKKPDPKPVDDPKKPLQPTPVPDVSRAQCQLVAVTYDTTYEYDSAFCSIL